MSPIESCLSACGHAQAPPLACERIGAELITRRCPVCDLELWWSVDRWQGVGSLPTEQRPRAPDLSRKVLGYREFFVDDAGQLCSVTTSNIWMPGPNRAACDARALAASRALAAAYPNPFQPRPVDHDCAAPAPGCMCGLYAYHSPPGWEHGRLKGQAAIGAVVTAWGHLEAHRNGFRAEWAEVIALVHDAFDGPLGRERSERAAALYGVPLIRHDELDKNELVKRAGERIPVQLLPPSPAPGLASPHFVSGASGGLGIRVAPYQGPGLIVPPGGPALIVPPGHYAVGAGGSVTLGPSPAHVAAQKTRRRQRRVSAAAASLNVGVAISNTYEFVREGHAYSLAVAIFAAVVAAALLVQRRRHLCS